ncbi:hypothetical protein D3C80_1722880 [compost metagenome]
MSILRDVFGFDLEEEARKALVTIEYKRVLAGEIASKVDSIKVNEQPVTVERVAQLLCVDFEALNKVMKGELETLTVSSLYTINLSFIHLANRLYDQRRRRYYQQLNKPGVTQ